MQFTIDFIERDMVTFDVGAKRRLLLNDLYRISRDGAPPSVTQGSEANNLFETEPGTKEVRARTRSLDVAPSCFAHIDCMKIVCEGSELNVMRGAARLLMRTTESGISVGYNRGRLVTSGATVADLTGYLKTIASIIAIVWKHSRGPRPCLECPGYHEINHKARQFIARLEIQKFN